MRVALFSVAAIAVLLCPLLAAQDESPAKTAAHWEWTGDSFETIKVELKPGNPIDQSTPRSVVRDYLRLNDYQGDMQPSLERLLSYLDELKAKQLGKLEEQLLTESARQALKKKDTGDDKGAAAPAFGFRTTREITGVTDAADGTAFVEVLETTTTTTPGKDGKPEKQSKNEEQVRFRCVKGEDHKWRIAGRETFSYDPSTDPPKKVWVVRQQGIIMLAAVAETQKDIEVVSLKQDSAEHAAQAVYVTLQRRDAELRTLTAKLWQRELNRVNSGLYAPSLRKLIEEQVAEQKEASKKFKGLYGNMYRAFDGEPPGVSSTDEPEAGVKVVKFELSSGRGHVEVTTKKVGDIWKVESAAVSGKQYDAKAKAWVDKLLPQANLYELLWP